jgi:hypothetical protein
VTNQKRNTKQTLDKAVEEINKYKAHQFVVFTKKFQLQVIEITNVIKYLLHAI